MNELQKNISLQSMNTFGIAATAQWFLPFKSVSELKEIFSHRVYQENDHVVLGGGSNILLTKNVDALVLKNEILGKEIIRENDNYAWVQFGAGEVWHDCVHWAIKNELGGIENLSWIPGTVGAAPMQNIGAYGVEIKSVIHEVQAIEKATGIERTFSNDDCQFGYRESIFKHSLKNKYIITGVILKLNKRHQLQLSYGAIQTELDARNISKPTIQDVSAVVISIRQSKLPDPNEIGNAGSFFKNPVVSQAVFQKLNEQYPAMPAYTQAQGVKIPAAWLIENAGWKGFQDGEIGVHKQQALVLVNYGNGAGLDIYNLSEKIIKDVAARYGIDLQREVNVL